MNSTHRWLCKDARKPNLAKSKTDTMKSGWQRLRINKEDSNFSSPNTNSINPDHTVPLADIAGAGCVKLRMEVVEPKFARSSGEDVEPVRRCPRRNAELPRCRKSRAETNESRRPWLKVKEEEPRKPTDPADGRTNPGRSGVTSSNKCLTTSNKCLTNSNSRSYEFNLILE